VVVVKNLLRPSRFGEPRAVSCLVSGEL